MGNKALPDSAVTGGKKMAPVENVLNMGFAERIIGALDRNDPRPGLGSRALLQ